MVIVAYNAAKNKWKVLSEVSLPGDQPSMIAPGYMNYVALEYRK